MKWSEKMKQLIRKILDSLMDEGLPIDINTDINTNNWLICYENLDAGSNLNIEEKKACEKLNALLGGQIKIVKEAGENRFARKRHCIFLDSDDIISITAYIHKDATWIQLGINADLNE